MKKNIYLDNAATTRTRAEVYKKMLPYMEDKFANPAGKYEFADISRQAVEEARIEIARALRCDSKEIFFTSGGTESDNWALRGAVRGKKKPHIITSVIEHHAILNTCAQLEKDGVRVTYIPVDEKGLISVKNVEKAICEDTILISIMTANNEIGTVQPIEAIGQLAKKYGVLFHTDAVQAFGHIPIDIESAGIDLMSASAHKFGGPKGCGFLYIRKDVEIEPFMTGGSQERSMRAGTLNVPGIVGMGEAARLAVRELEMTKTVQEELRDHLIDKIMSTIPYVRLNGARKNRLPNNVNVSFQFVEGTELLTLLDEEGIYASAASACQMGGVSHVIRAIGVQPEYEQGTLRLTLGLDTTLEDVDRAVIILKEKVERLRSMSESYRRSFMTAEQLGASEGRY